MSQPDIHALLECLQTSLQTMIQTHGKFLQSRHVVMLTLVHRPHLLLPVHFSILQAEKSRIRALEQGYRLTLNNLNWFLGGIIFKVKNSRSTINCFPKGTSGRLQSCSINAQLATIRWHCFPPTATAVKTSYTYLSTYGHFIPLKPSYLFYLMPL